MHKQQPTECLFWSVLLFIIHLWWCFSCSSLCQQCDKDDNSSWGPGSASGVSDVLDAEQWHRLQLDHHRHWCHGQLHPGPGRYKLHSAPRKCIHTETSIKKVIYVDLYCLLLALYNHYNVNMKPLLHILV